jgi:urease accessory protein
MNRLGWLALAVVLTPSPAAAHAPFVGAEGFYGGLLHPLLVPAHAIALAALGLLAGQRGTRPRNVLLVVFTVALIGGLAAIALGTGETSAGDVLVAAAAIAGLLVALGRPPPAPVEWIVAAVIGATIGLDSPPEVISLRTATVMLIGTGFGACILVTVIGEITSVLTRDWQRIGIRVLGSWAAASAILVLALRFAPG